MQVLSPWSVRLVWCLGESVFVGTRSVRFCVCIDGFGLQALILFIYFDPAFYLKIKQTNKTKIQNLPTTA